MITKASQITTAVKDFAGAAAMALSQVLGGLFAVGSASRQGRPE